MARPAVPLSPARVLEIEPRLAVHIGLQAAESGESRTLLDCDVGGDPEKEFSKVPRFCRVFLTRLADLMYQPPSKRGANGAMFRQGEAESEGARGCDPDRERARRAARVAKLLPIFSCMLGSMRAKVQHMSQLQTYVAATLLLSKGGIKDAAISLLKKLNISDGANAGRKAILEASDLLSVPVVLRKMVDEQLAAERTRPLHGLTEPEPMAAPSTARNPLTVYHMDNADIMLVGMDHHVLGLGVTWLQELMSQIDSDCIADHLDDVPALVASRGTAESMCSTPETRAVMTEATAVQNIMALRVACAIFVGKAAPAAPPGSVVLRVGQRVFFQYTAGAKVEGVVTRLSATHCTIRRPRDSPTGLGGGAAPAAGFEEFTDLRQVLQRACSSTIIITATVSKQSLARCYARTLIIITT